MYEKFTLGTWKCPNTSLFWATSYFFLCEIFCLMCLFLCNAMTFVYFECGLSGQMLFGSSVYMHPHNRTNIVLSLLMTAWECSSFLMSQDVFSTNAYVFMYHLITYAVIISLRTVRNSINVLLSWFPSGQNISITMLCILYIQYSVINK